MTLLASLARGRLTWVVVGALGALIWVQAEVSKEDPGVARRLVLTVLPLLAFTGSLTASVWRRRWLAAAVLVLAVTPAALSAVASASGAGAVAMVVAALCVWLDALADRFGLGFVAVAGGVASSLLVVAMVAGTAVRDGAGPSAEKVPSLAGDVLRAAVGSVGDPAVMIPAPFQLLWWVGVVLAAGAALRRGSVLRAVAPLLAAASVAVLSAAILFWRGPLDPVRAAWMLAVGVALTTVPVSRPRAPGRSLALVIVTIGSLCWLAGAVQQVRSATVAVAGDPDLPWSRWPRLPGVAVDSRVLIAVAAVAAAVVPVLLWMSARRGRPPRGIELIGYFDRPSGLGERARTLAAAARAAGVPLVEHTVGGAVSAPIYDTTIAVVTAQELPGVAGQFPSLFAPDRRRIGYWFWELAEAPDAHRRGLELVDEVWAPTRFVAEAYARLAERTVSRPVRVVPLPIPPPCPDPVRPESFGFADGRFVFVTSFDHLSVMERKNPIGVVAAFRMAFPVGDEHVRLVIKSIHGDQRPAAAARLTEAANGDARITVIDEVWPAGRVAALLGAADAFVGLHRSEGLGLQPAEAAWLGTPVIVTAYSGVLDLFDGSCAVLVPATLVPVTHGDDAYPASGWWADPDLDVAAAAMRRLVEDPAYAESLGRAGQQRMRAQADLRGAGRALARRLWWRPPAR